MEWEEWDSAFAELWAHCDSCNECVQVQDSVALSRECKEGQEFAKRLGVEMIHKVKREE
jgi:hypothetical protein